MIARFFTPFIFLLAVTMTATPISIASASPQIFETMSGSWRGKGFITTSSEADAESIRCKMRNSHKSDERTIALSGNCAVAGFVFSLRGWIAQDGKKNAYQASMFRSIASLKQSVFQDGVTENQLTSPSRHETALQKKTCPPRSFW